MNVQQRLHDPPDGGSRLLVDAEHEDPAVAARWVATDVAKAAIQRDQKPSGGSCRRCWTFMTWTP